MTVLAIKLAWIGIPTGWPAAGSIGILTLLGIGILIRGRSSIVGTTLTAAWGWLLVSLLAQAVNLAAAAMSTGGDWNAPLGYAAAITSFGPIVAVLGAKQPQNRAWQWIVLTLLVVLALPSGEFMLLRRGTPFTLHAARAWFVAILATVGWLNYLPTRHVVAATGYFLSQLFQLAAYLPWLLWPRPELQAWLGLLFGVASLAVLRICRAPAASASWDRAWVDFRNTFGAVWGLRVMERCNAALRAGDGPGQLTWHGFCGNGRIGTENPADVSQVAGEPIDPLALQALARNLRPLLRRFVSDEWIALRCGEETAPEKN